MAAWPVYVIGADDATPTITVAAESYFDLTSSHAVRAEDRMPIRQYVTQAVTQRPQQRGFREREV